jgi:hypothetical protein
MKSALFLSGPHKLNYRPSLWMNFKAHTSLETVWRLDIRQAL